MFRIFVFLILAMTTANCAATDREKALQNRIDQLEGQLAFQQGAPVLQQPQKIRTSDDPLYETYKILHRIEESQVNQISSLSYAQNVADPNVTIYPLGNSSVSDTKNLNERAEQYPRHLLQLGQDIYTEQQQENIIVFPIKDPAIEDMKPVQPVTASSGGRMLSAQQATTNSKKRRLTGY